MKKLYFTGLVRVDIEHEVQICDEMSWCEVGVGTVRMELSSGACMYYNMRDLCRVDDNPRDEQRVSPNLGSVAHMAGMRSLSVSDIPSIVTTKFGSEIQMELAGSSGKSVELTVMPTSWWVRLLGESKDVTTPEVECCNLIGYDKEARRCKNVGEVMTAFAQQDSYASVLDNYELLPLEYDERGEPAGGLWINGKSCCSEPDVDAVVVQLFSGLKLTRVIESRNWAVWKAEYRGDVVWTDAPERIRAGLLALRPGFMKENDPTLTLAQMVEQGGATAFGHRLYAWPTLSEYIKQAKLHRGSMGYIDVPEVRNPTSEDQ